MAEGLERVVDQRVVFGPAAPSRPLPAEVRHAVVVLDGIVRQVRVLLGVGRAVCSPLSRELGIELAELGEEGKAVTGEDAKQRECCTTTHVVNKARSLRSDAESAVRVGKRVNGAGYSRAEQGNMLPTSSF